MSKRDNCKKSWGVTKDNGIFVDGVQYRVTDGDTEWFFAEGEIVTFSHSDDRGSRWFQGCYSGLMQCLSDKDIDDNLEAVL